MRPVLERDQCYTLETGNSIEESALTASFRRLFRKRVDFSAWHIGLICYAWSTVLVVLAARFGFGFIQSPTKPAHFSKCFSNWDGNQYILILRDGYSFAAKGQSTAAFFPAYPCLGWLAMKATGLPAAGALLLVSHISLALALVLLAAYVRLRFPSAPAHLPALAVLAAAIFPTSFFFRMAYSESLFLCCSILVFYLMAREAPALLIAAVIGFATAVRIPGVCLLIPFAMYLWARFTGKSGFARSLLLLSPVACWGVIAFMVFCTWKFGEPLAFAKAQAQWYFRLAPSLATKLYSLATLEPLRSVFHRSGSWYWKNHAADGNPVYCLVVANPVYFVLALVLISLGAWRRWLSAAEWAFAGSLLLLGYAARGYEMCMSSSGRFVAVAFPIYLVIGRLLSYCPIQFRGGFVAASAIFLALYSALFAAYHFLI